tara:strand:+ start:13727 stop:13963 length:237 start_codon:yes stop_codon:yes gene_type:complete
MQITNKHGDAPHNNNKASNDIPWSEVMMDILASEDYTLDKLVDITGKTRAKLMSLMLGDASHFDREESAIVRNIHRSL